MNNKLMVLRGLFDDRDGKNAYITFKISGKEFRQLLRDSREAGDTLFHTISWLINTALDDGRDGYCDLITERDILVYPPDGVNIELGDQI